MSFERDIRLLTVEAALCEPVPASRLELMGPDRERFFGGMVTAAIEGLEPGTGRFGFITDVRGRILASAAVLALEDRLWLEIPKGRGRTIIEHLDKYIGTDQGENLRGERREREEVDEAEETEEQIARQGEVRPIAGGGRGGAGHAAL